MKKIEFLYKDLEKYKDFDIDGNCEKFLDTVDQIVLRRHPESIEILLRYFDDNSDYGWVLENLENSIFFLLNNGGFSFFLKNFHLLLLKNAKKYLLDMIDIILNENKNAQKFKENMYHASKDNLLELFDIMEVESPHHYDLIQELRKELEKKL